MAIDDNTNYELTGAQVKDLASKINAKEDSADLAAVAESGDYTDLINTPTIPTKTSDLTNDGSDNTSVYVEADELAAVATSGDYDDLLNKPTIPAAQIQSDWTQATTTALDYIKNKPEIRHVNSESDAGWSADANKLVDGSVLAYWNGAYSGTASNLQYFKDNSIGCNHFNEWSTANTTDTWVPVGNGDKIQHRVIKPFNADGTIPTSAIADGAVTDAKLATPHWKVVSVANSNSWVIPAGYRFYRVYMAADAPTGGSVAHICVNGKYGTSYSTGPYTEGSSTYSYAGYWSNDDVGYADTGGVTGSGHNYTININIARASTSDNWYRGYYTSSGGGADWTVQGKLEFAASDNFNFYINRNGSAINNCFGYVEALVE